MFTIDFIPLSNYRTLFYDLTLFITLFSALMVYGNGLTSKINREYIKILGALFFGFTLLYIGLRPVSGRYFTDMATYNRIFQDYARGMPARTDKDTFFHLFTWLSSKVMSAQTYFLVCAALYIIPLYVVSKKWFKAYWFYAFLLLVGSFSFWAYGTNGIRNGIAGSLFLLAISRDKRVFQILLLILAINFHKTMLLPAIGFAITQFYNKPQGFYYFWLLSIPLSLAFPGVWENVFANLLEDSRSAYFTAEADEEKFSSTGFRWDFLIYGAFGVVAGWYYIFKKKIADETYISLYNTFLFANAFWILVIRANFSNRFAYLSWFMLALVIVYPWGKYIFEKEQHKKLPWVMLAYVGFTYFMGNVLKMI